MKNDGTNTKMHFPTEFDAILDRIANLDPVSYDKSRNYIDGAVSYLSPYISRGVISTKFVYQELLKRNFHPNKILKFIQDFINDTARKEVSSILKNNALIEIICEAFRGSGTE